MGQTTASRGGVGVGKTAGEPGSGVRLFSCPHMDGAETHPVEREEAVLAAGVRPPQVPPLEDGPVRGETDLLQLLRRALRLGELLRVVRTVHMCEVQMSRGG